MPQQVPNPHPFSYILNNPNVCRDQDIYLLVYVHTAPDHFKQRSLIRETWGSMFNYDVNVRTIFVLGRMTNNLTGRVINDALELEFELYYDIIQEDFIDTYYNLTYKAVAGVRWIDEQCSHARWVLKLDDDTFVNMFNLLRYLHCLDRHDAVDNSVPNANAGNSTRSEKANIPTRSTRNLFLCLVWYVEAHCFRIGSCSEHYFIARKYTKASKCGIYRLDTLTHQEFI